MQTLSINSELVPIGPRDPAGHPLHGPGAVGPGPASLRPQPALAQLLLWVWPLWRPDAPFLTSCTCWFLRIVDVPTVRRQISVVAAKARSWRNHCGIMPTALRLQEYEDEAEYGWVLLAAAPEAAGAGAGAAGPVDDAMEVDEAA